MAAFLVKWPTCGDRSRRDGDSTRGESPCDKSASGKSNSGDSRTCDESTMVASATTERCRAGSTGMRFIALGRHWRFAIAGAADAAESDVGGGRVDWLRESRGRSISSAVVRRAQVGATLEDFSWD